MILGLRCSLFDFIIKNINDVHFYIRSVGGIMTLLKLALSILKVMIFYRVNLSILFPDL